LTRFSWPLGSFSARGVQLEEARREDIEVFLADHLAR
jgi:hypothetical protein